MHAVLQVQELSDRPRPVLSSDIRPLCDVDGFDSLNAEEACMIIAEETGIEATLSVFQTYRGSPASIAEIAENLCCLAMQEKGEPND